jgi:tetratricopeptide (TPR) repeat protein
MNGDFCQEDFAKALEAFQFQQSLDEDNTLVISDIADAYFGMKEFREAIRCYELADKTNPDLHFDYDLGRCYLNLKEYSTALHYFLTALHQDTGPIIPVLIIENVVYILKILDKYDDARAFLRKCLVNFKDGAPVVLRELITLLNPKTDLEELHELCLKAIALSLETDNDLYPFFSFMVSYCYDEDCPDLGLDMCNVYSDHVSLLHSIHYFQSLLYLKKGQFTEAFSHLELALSFDNTRLGIDFLDMDDDLRNIPEVLRLMQQYDADKYNNLH